MLNFTPAELRATLDGVFRIENPKAWLKKQLGQSNRYVSQRRGKKKNKRPRR